jgi:protein involved in polysaccharide export with SLBB domain
MMSTSNPAPQPVGLLARAALLACLAATPLLTGCTTLLSPIDTIPAERVPPQFLAEPQADKVPIDVSRLRQPKPEYYLIDKDDILGIYIEGILGEIGEAPPVVMPPPEQGSDLPPAVGFPIPVREDGTISLPLVKPVAVRGLNIQQVEQLIARTYRDGEKPLLTEDARIIVTLMRERTYRVFVVRQDNTINAQNPIFAQTALSIGVTDRSDQSGRGFVLQMPAYKNDLLNALAQTGGLPGLNARSEVRILRGNRLSQKQRDAEVDEFYRSHGPDEFPYGQLPAIGDESNVVKIPTRIKPTDNPQFRTEDIILRDGDIVYVDSRNTDFFYTGGLLRGGEFLIPRDYDLDVIGAVSLAGGAQLGSGGGFGGSFSGVTGASPTELILLRRLPGQRQIAIRIDLNRAINDPRSRLLVKAGDTILLRYKPQEEIANLALGTFFTYGISNLFNRR